jgi:hypothetical protein
MHCAAALCSALLACGPMGPVFLRFIGLILDNVVQSRIMDGDGNGLCNSGKALQATWTYIINALACICIAFMFCFCGSGGSDGYEELYLPVMGFWALLRFAGAAVAMAFGLLLCDVGLVFGSEVLGVILIITIPFEAMIEH